MRYFNQDKTVELDINAVDMFTGYFKNDFLETVIPAVEGVEEKGHYEVIAEYPNGGKDVEWIVDVPGVEAQPKRVEREPICVFVPYSEEESKSLKTNQEINELKQKLNETDYQAIKYAEGIMSEKEYLPIKTQRAEWRAKINELEKLIGA